MTTTESTWIAPPKRGYGRAGLAATPSSSFGQNKQQNSEQIDRRSDDFSV